jgi:hypothetical protein
MARTFYTPIYLPASNPTNANEASRKAYVDTMLPLAGGTMTGLFRVGSGGDNTQISAAGNVTLSGTATLTLAAAPTSDLHAATKAYVDAINAGLDPKGSVLAATTANLTTGGGAGNHTYAGTTSATITKVDTNSAFSIDGQTVNTVGQRVLVKNQTNTYENGIYQLTTAAASGVSAVLTRSDDMNANAEATVGVFTIVEAGTTNAGRWYYLTAIGTGNLGATTYTQTWTQSAGSGSYVADETTLELVSGTTFRIKDSGVTAAKIAASVAGNGLIGGAGSALAVGAGFGITVNADDIAKATFKQDIGDGMATSFTVTHNLTSKWCHVQVYKKSDGTLVDTDVTLTNSTSLSISGFATAPSSNEFTVLVSPISNAA